MDEIGSSLREARMHARIDITEVEAATKIRAKYLRALENEEWDLLPGPVYVRSFLKTYGDFLGLDSGLLVDEFKRRYERPTDYEVRSAGMASNARERDRGGDRGSGVAQWLFSPRGLIVVAIIVIIVALYVIGSHNGGKNNDSARVTPSTKSTGGSTNHHAGNGSGQSGKTGAGKGAGGKINPAGTTSTPSTTTTGTGTGTGTTPAGTTPTQATLAMTATAEVWVCVEDANGKVLIPGRIYTAGDPIPTQHSSALLVTLGNTHVTMTVDGKPYAPSGSSAIGLRITPQGAAPLSPAPTCGE